MYVCIVLWYNNHIGSIVLKVKVTSLSCVLINKVLIFINTKNVELLVIYYENNIKMSLGLEMSAAMIFQWKRGTFLCQLQNVNNAGSLDGS